MDLEFKKFQQEYYADYYSWFTDPMLNRELGPMEQDTLEEEWLTSTLAESDSEGITWAIFRNNKLVAVAEVFFDPGDSDRAHIRSIAVQPALRGQGLGVGVLQHILKLNYRRGIHRHTALIMPANFASQRCFAKVGFKTLSAEPNEQGYIEFEHSHEEGWTYE
jgi:RimJ/RimL family protein N-acetyltransferase